MGPRSENARGVLVRILAPDGAPPTRRKRENGYFSFEMCPTTGVLLLTSQAACRVARRVCRDIQGTSTTRIAVFVAVRRWGAARTSRIALRFQRSPRSVP